VGINDKGYRWDITEGYELGICFNANSKGKDAVPMKLSIPEGPNEKTLGSAPMSRTSSGRAWVAVY